MTNKIFSYAANIVVPTIVTAVVGVCLFINSNVSFMPDDYSWDGQKTILVLILSSFAGVMTHCLIALISGFNNSRILSLLINIIGALGILTGLYMLVDTAQQDSNGLLHYSAPLIYMVLGGATIIIGQLRDRAKI